ncbi:MAG: hypothetical protein ABW128_07020 [Rhizorhabdus sp.]
MTVEAVGIAMVNAPLAFGAVPLTVFTELEAADCAVDAVEAAVEAAAAALDAAFCTA